jgi:hypothetical protein
VPAAVAPPAVREAATLALAVCAPPPAVAVPLVVVPATVEEAVIVPPEAVAVPAVWVAGASTDTGRSVIDPAQGVALPVQDHVGLIDAAPGVEDCPIRLPFLPMRVWLPPWVSPVVVLLVVSTASTTTSPDADDTVRLVAVPAAWTAAFSPAVDPTPDHTENATRAILLPVHVRLLAPADGAANTQTDRPVMLESPAARPAFQVSATPLYDSAAGVPPVEAAQNTTR